MPHFLRHSVVAMLLHDLSSDFNTDDYTTLISLFNSRFTVSGQALAWFSSYLTDRAQVFTTNCSQLLLVALTVGVQQSSGLDPSQFTAYTEDITSIFSTCDIQYHLFADDTQSYYHCLVHDIPDFVFRLQVSIDDLAIDLTFLAVCSLTLLSLKLFIWFPFFILQNTSKIPQSDHLLHLCPILRVCS